MTDRVVETFAKTDGQERLIIVQRPDGNFSFRRQWLSQHANHHPDSPIPERGSDAGGDPPFGSYCGIYHSAEAAMQEALGRVDWLASATARR